MVLFLCYNKHIFDMGLIWFRRDTSNLDGKQVATFHATKKLTGNRNQLAFA